MHTIRIGSYYETPPMDYEQPGLFTWREFYNFRNHVIRLLRIFGTAGPMGEVDLSIVDEDQPSFSSEIVDDPAFFVVDEMYNEHDRVSRVECDPACIDAVVIESLSAMMLAFPGWQVSFGLGDSGLVVFSDAVLVGGRRFWDCTSVLEISDRCQKPVEFGPSEPLSESMHELWRSIFTGGIDQSAGFPKAPSRQWAEVIRSLEAMRSQRKDGRLTSFAYDQIRHDLHPSTRRELLDRLLHDLPTFPRTILTEAERNIKKASGNALADCASPEDASTLIDEIWTSLEAISDKFGQNDIVNWWANLIHEVKEPSEWLRAVLQDAMRVRVKHPNALFQLSALFGLARLGAHDIASLVDDAMITRPEWRMNSMLMSWLGKLKAKKSYYPDRKMLDSPEELGGAALGMYRPH
jgi:hypothetical protein